jgi:hypothetical protein
MSCLELDDMYDDSEVPIRDLSTDPHIFLSMVFCVCNFPHMSCLELDDMYDDSEVPIRDFPTDPHIFLCLFFVCTG